MEQVRKKTVTLQIINVTMEKVKMLELNCLQIMNSY